MSDFVTSLIRTYVPTGVGIVVAWITAAGVELEAGTELALSGAIVAVVTAVWYFAARLLEARWPAAGYLLGVAKTPVYDE